MNSCKISKVFPLLKSSDADRMSPAEYRPVSLLPVLSKITERAAQSQILDFMEKTGQLNHAAHAYRKSLSTTSTLAAITDEMYMATEKKRIVQLMTIDQSSAFDCINHTILLRKLRVYNMDKGVIEWVKNYLSLRTQYVQIGAVDSVMRRVDMGVPQWSVMGPILYAIYVNEMTETVR